MMAVQTPKNHRSQVLPDRWTMLGLSMVLGTILLLYTHIASMKERLPRRYFGTLVEGEAPIDRSFQGVSRKT
jgi:hypothetical protein